MPRIKFLRGVILTALAVIAVRLFVIQIVEHEQWLAKAAEQHTMLETIVAERGDIYMMDGGEPVKVVMNQTVYSVIIDPLMVDREAIKATLEKNAKANLTINLDKLFENDDLRYYVVAKNVSREVAMKIAAENIDYVWFQENTKRVYPEGEMASGLLGFVNADGDGQYGVEGALNARLAGTNGLLKTIADVNRVALSIGNDNVKVPAVDGDDIVLTIDRGLQQKTEEILVNTVAHSKATNAAAIIMDPMSGEILTMANVPNYNPADYGNVKNAAAYINYTVEEPYEPASVCKTFMFATAINEGVMTGETTYRNTGSTVVDGETIVNAYHGQYGVVTMNIGLRFSLNTSSVQALRLLSGSETEITEAGRQKMYDYYYNRFGLGKYTGVEIYENPGLIVGPNDGWAMNLTYANMTFGQGLNLTMLQVARAFSAVINGGKEITPTLVKGKMENGKLVAETKETVGNELISEATSLEMRRLLYDARVGQRNRGVDKAGYYIGGKTGTAQVIKDGKYTDAETGETIASYVGFVGATKELPKYVIMVKIWGEGQHMSGESDAMPIFNTLSNFVIDYMRIQPEV